MPAQPCLRFDRHGNRCTNLTENIDRWCRAEGCDGFLRGSTANAPESQGRPRGTRAHLAHAASIRPEGIDFDRVDDVIVTRRALDAFRFHHGGDDVAARTELLVMLEDFSLKGVSRGEGYLTLSRDGFELVLSPDHDALVHYRTVHRERTWSQCKAGIRSRFGAAARPARPRGEPVVLDRPQDVLTLVDPAVVHLTSTAFSRWDARVRQGAVASADPESELRSALAADVAAQATVDRVESGAYLVTGPRATWILSPDLTAVIGLRPAPAASPDDASPTTA